MDTRGDMEKLEEIIKNEVELFNEARQENDLTSSKYIQKLMRHDIQLYKDTIEKNYNLQDYESGMRSFIYNLTDIFDYDLKNVGNMVIYEKRE